MITRTLIATAVLTSSLVGVAVTSAPLGPTLFVFSGPGPNNGTCGGCVAFDDAMQRRDFRQTLQQLVSIRGPYDVRDRRYAGIVRDYKVTSWPTFVLVYRGQTVQRAIGFENSAEFRSGFLRSLTNAVGLNCESGICKPIAEPRTLPPATIGPGTSVAPSAVNPVDRIVAINQRLQQRLQDTEDALRLSEDRLQAERKRPDVSADVERWAAERRLLESARQRAIAEADALRERLRQPPVVPIASPLSEISAEMPEAGGTSSKWHSILNWTVGTALTLAAPEYVLPVSVAGTALGFGVNWWRRRHRAHTEIGETHADTPHDKVREITKFRTVETDQEAVRIRKAMKDIAGEYPNAAAWVNMVESAVKLIKSGE